MANGILIVDKPADWTSQDVVSKLRGVFHERRAVTVINFGVPTKLLNVYRKHLQN